ncbi:MAG: sugar transferase [Clostridiales bacterium]|nr:sugar transferase [Clostridiales bacterium]
METILKKEAIFVESPALKNEAEENAHLVTLNRKNELRRHRRYWVLRRGQDILYSALALIILSPLLALIALVIYIDDPKGSPIFTQVRCGRDGKPFRLYKFRTMCVGAEDMLKDLLEQNEMDGPVFKIKDDPRITRVGHFLRRTSLDELPQLWNILKGEMSIVGPRPALPRELELYDDYQRQRMYVTPGLTCYWQIQPERNEISFDDWMELDIKYIRERSFWVDWKIIFQTVKVVLQGRGE